MLITEDVLKELGAVPTPTEDTWLLVTREYDFTIRKFELVFEGHTTSWQVDGRSHINTVAELIAIAYDFGYSSVEPY